MNTRAAPSLAERQTQPALSVRNHNLRRTNPFAMPVLSSLWPANSPAFGRGLFFRSLFASTNTRQDANPMLVKVVGLFPMSSLKHAWEC